jgi:hypothetical protein
VPAERIRIDPETVSTEELLRTQWESGDLSPFMHAGQRQLHKQWNAWRSIDPLSVPVVDGSKPIMFCVGVSKRWGKTTWILWAATELGLERPGCEIRVTSAFQKSIDEIVGKVMPQAFATAPPSCRPTYHGKRGLKPAGLYFPKQGPLEGAYIALAGLDMNPNALRGQSSDFDFISEAAFCRDLDYVVTNILVHQYQGKPHARACLESSAPKDPLTDWEVNLIPDAKRRGAWFEATIEDNPRLSKKEIALFISMAGGRDHPDCRREYFNEIIGDPTLQVFPGFKPEVHVREHPMPPHAYTITSADPGQTHQFGLLFGYYDFDAAVSVIQDSWAESNASTRKVACVCAAREFDLWGTWPPHGMKNIPLETEGIHTGWRDLLKHDRCEHLAELLHSMAQTPPEQRPHFESRPGRWITTPQPQCLTYFDNDMSIGFHTNPQTRVSDIDLTFIRDIDTEFGLSFHAADKSAPLEARVNLSRNRIEGGGLVFTPDAGPIIDHIRAAKWNKQRSKFDEHPVYGHYDLAAALVYWLPACDMIRHRRPHPPAGIESLGTAGHDVQQRLPWQPRSKAEEALDLVRRLWMGKSPDRGRMKSYR